MDFDTEYNKIYCVFRRTRPWNVVYRKNALDPSNVIVEKSRGVRTLYGLSDVSEIRFVLFVRRFCGDFQTTRALFLLLSTGVRLKQYSADADYNVYLRDKFFVLFFFPAVYRK